VVHLCGLGIGSEHQQFEPSFGHEISRVVGGAGIIPQTGHTKPKDGAPLQRALMRVEAELLIEEADSISCRHPQDRTHGQRAADAFGWFKRSASERRMIH